MTITPLGKLLRRMRDDNSERLYDMAERLERPSSFISAIEFGKKAPPKELVEKIIEAYNLDPAMAAEIRIAADLSSRSIKLDLQGAGQPARELAHAFARQFNQLEPEKVQKLLYVLTEESEHVRSSG